MEENEKKISVFGAAKLKPTAKSAKEDKTIVTVTGLESKLVEYSTVNAELTDAKAQLGAVTDEIKTISREKFTELYLANKENPHSFLIQAGDECVMVIPSDKYEKVDDEARAEQLISEYGKDVVTTTERFYFNPAVIDRSGEAIKKLVDDLIINSKDISEDDKVNLLTKEVSYAITKGTIDDLVSYAAKTDIATVVKDIRPIFQLKNCGGDEKALGGDLIKEIPLITGWSACHWAPLYGDTDVCPVCGEHTHVLDDEELKDALEGTEENEQLWEVKGYDEGGTLNEELESLMSALPYVEGEDKALIESRIKEIQESEKKPKGKARQVAHVPDSHTPAEVEPIEQKPIKEVAPAKGKGLFDSAKAKPAAKKGKADKIIISIPELATQLAVRTSLKADVESLEDKMSAVAEEVKRIAVEKFIELYQKTKKNPETFLVKDGKGCIMVLPVDNYIKIDEDKAAWLTRTYGSKIVTVTERYYFNTEVLQRNQATIETIIGDADISNEDKENLLLREVKYVVTKGLIDDLAKYGNKMNGILEDIHPVFMLKACGKMKKGGKFSSKGNLRDELILDVPLLMGYSNCCYAPVYGESDICSKCGEHCMVLSEEEARNELAEQANEMANGGSAGEFNYRLLGRLCSDCDYFLGNGNRNEKSLWAGNVHDQIEEMKKLWNKLPVKPEWLSMEDLLEYERKMKNQYAQGGSAAMAPKILKEFDVVDHENNLITTLSVDNGADYAEARKIALRMLKELYPQEYPHLKLLYAGAQSQMFEVGGSPGDDLPLGEGRSGSHERLKAIFLKKAPKNSLAGEKFIILEQDRPDDLSIKFKDESGLTFVLLKTPAKKFRLRVSAWTENVGADTSKTIAKRILEEEIEPLMAIFGKPINKKDMDKKEKGGQLDAEWEKKAKDALIGKEVRTATFMTKEEGEAMGWGDGESGHCLVIEFKDKSFIYASDDEGNNPGFFALTSSLIEESNYDLIRKHLAGAVITDVNYMHPAVAEDRMLSHRPLILILKKKFSDGKHEMSFTVTALTDPEGNDGGAIFGQTAKKEELNFPVLR